MATSGELRALNEELEMVDIGDAASYLGEEIIVGEDSIVTVQQAVSRPSGRPRPAQYPIYPGKK